MPEIQWQEMDTYARQKIDSLVSMPKSSTKNNFIWKRSRKNHFSAATFVIIKDTDLGKTRFHITEIFFVLLHYLINIFFNSYNYICT